MEHQKIKNGTIVQVNAPDATAIHGTNGIVKSWDPAHQLFTVAMHKFNGSPSFLREPELVPLATPYYDDNEELPPIPKITEPAPFTPQTVLKIIGNDADTVERFAMKLLDLVGR